MVWNGGVDGGMERRCGWWYGTEVWMVVWNGGVDGGMERRCGSAYLYHDH